MTNSTPHTPVLLNETIGLLNIKPNGIYVDATAGFGGHASAIYQKLNQKGLLICIDQDLAAIKYLQNKFANKSNVKIVHDNFIHLKEILNDLAIQLIDGVIADLGVSSYMLDEKERGFSFHSDEKLDMRMDQNQRLSAYEVVNHYDEKELARIFIYYGDSKYAKSVAQSIVNTRKNQSIETTEQLVSIIKSALPKSVLIKHKHPAKIYFQAIRMEVNHELENLQKFIDVATKLLNQNGVLAIISFHSLEDRLVKKSFVNLTTNRLPKELGINEKIDYQVLTKHPIVPTTKEISNNRRSHSAKLRGIERIKYV